MSAPAGRLKISLETPDPYVAQPVNVIDGDSLQLVAAAKCGEEIEVPAGTYLVSATLPSGERSVGVAEVTAGELSELSLGVETAETSAAPAAMGGLESLGPVDQPAVTAPLAPGTFFVRFHVQTPADGFRPAEPQVAVTSSAGDRAELTVSASGDGILFAQACRPGEVPLNVALPIYGPTISQSCLLTVEGGAALAADVSLPDNPQIDAVARFLKGGNVQEAASVGGDAKHLLEAKMADPFGAALGGYALLRSGQHDRLHHWPRNLADWFAWLPDGAVIAGEEAALEGDHTLAIQYVCDAARRGLPVFGTGLSLLASRLREYSAAPVSAFGDNGKLVAEAGRLLERLLALMPFVDFDRVSLAYRAAKIDDPAGSQTPFAPGEEGWRDVTEL
jgi:hypothetical protein